MDSKEIKQLITLMASLPPHDHLDPFTVIITETWTAENCTRTCRDQSGKILWTDTWPRPPIQFLDLSDANPWSKHEHEPNKD